MMSSGQHAHDSIQRTDKHESGTTAAARDDAAMQGLLRKRNRQERVVKEEKRKSKTPRALEGSGVGSKHDPLVID